MIFLYIYNIILLINLNKILYLFVYLYVCENMKFSSTRSTPETNLVPLRCILVIRVKVTQRKTECLKFESGFCVIFYESDKNV